MMMHDTRAKSTTAATSLGRGPRSVSIVHRFGVGIVICAAYAAFLSRTGAGEPSEKWLENHRFASLTIYVKSNRDDISIGGARVRIRRQARKKRDLRRDPALMPISPWKEADQRTDGRGKVVITDWRLLTGSGRGGKAMVKRDSPRPWTYVEVEVSATDFRSATESVWISFWEATPTCYVYLSPR